MILITLLFPIDYKSNPEIIDYYATQIFCYVVDLRLLNATDHLCLTFPEALFQCLNIDDRRVEFWFKRQ